MREIPVSEMKGFKIGHAQDVEHATGCTAILCEQGAWAGVDVRGGSPASRETELLRPVNTVQQIHCVMLSGGSAFGLEAGDGAMQFLAERDVGFDTGFGKVPIVCGASLFDLELVSNKVRPDKAMGYAACVDAMSGKEPAQGNVGAGTGATVGKFHGPTHMMKAGLGIYAAQSGAVQCAAIVAVNALGDIMDYDTKKLMAGLLTDDGSAMADTVQVMYREIENNRKPWAGNTTIGCVITNAKLDKCQCNKLASIAHNGYAQAIRPVHCAADGDTIFLMTTGEVEVGVDAVGALITECMGRAINRAALNSAPAYGLKSAQSFL